MSKFINLIFLFIFSIPNLSYGFTNSKDWCLPQNKYQRNIPFHKLEDGNKCPSNTKQISKEKALNIFLTNYDGYLNQIIVSGTICNDTYKNYKYLRELIREEKNLDCNRIKAELLKKNQKKKQKAIDQKKAEEEAKIKALAEKLAKEEIAKQLRKKELAKKKENQKSSQNKFSKTKEEALFFVKVLKEYVQTDNDLDILEIGDLLSSYTTQVNKGWSDKTISSYNKLFKYASSDKNFIKYLDKKKTEQKQKYEKEVLQLKNELKSSQKLLSNYIKKNLGTDEANSALELAKKAKSILKKFNYKEAIQLKVKISKWKSKNGLTKNNKKEKTKIKRVVSKSPNVSNIKKEKGKYPEFLKNKYWFNSKSVNGYSYKNGFDCKKIVKDMKNDWLTFFNFNESNVISYSRSNEKVDGFRYRIGAYEKNRNFIFGYSIKNGNGYKKNTGYTRYTDTEVPDEIIIHENFNTGSLKRIMLYNQKHQILVGKKIIETIDKDVEEDTFKVRFNWCSSQPPKVNLALSDEQALEKFGKNVKVKPKNNKNKSQLKVGDFPEFLIGKTWFSSSVYNRSRLSCNEVYRKAKNVIGYTRYESKNMYSYIRSKISSMRPMDNEAKATIEVIEIGNKTRFKVVSQRFIAKDGMCYTTSIKEYDPSNETLKNIGCSSTYCSVTGNNNRLNKTRCLNRGNVSNYCFGYPSR